MSEEQRIQQVVAEVLKRLLPHVGANGEQGTVTVVFSGATAGFTEALQQIRSLVLRGFRLELVFSRGAEDLHTRHVWEELDGFPHITALDSSRWLRAVKETQAIVVPMLSVNTLSKLSLLIGDNLASNVILHGLFMGKPVILVQNGVDPSDAGRIEPHFPGASAGLARAIEERLQVARSYGCTVTGVSRLANTLEYALAPASTKSSNVNCVGRRAAPAPERKSNLVTAADVLQAHHLGTQLRVRSSTIITPLARELATKHGVCFLQNTSS
jgi:hypothetical protein